MPPNDTSAPFETVEGWTLDDLTAYAQQNPSAEVPVRDLSTGALHVVPVGTVLSNPVAFNLSGDPDVPVGQGFQMPDAPSGGPTGQEGPQRIPGTDTIRVPEYITDPLTGETSLAGYQYIPMSEGPGGGGGGQVSSSQSQSWSGQWVNDALKAAESALSGYLQAQSLADARKLAAAEQFQKMAQFALPQGQMPPGFGEGEAMHQLAAGAGRGTYRPPPIQHQKVNPAALDPYQGRIPPEILQMIEGVQDAAGAGQVVTTGGSTSTSSSRPA